MTLSGFLRFLFRGVLKLWILIESYSSNLFHIQWVVVANIFWGIGPLCLNCPIVYIKFLTVLLMFVVIQWYPCFILDIVNFCLLLFGSTPKKGGSLSRSLLILLLFFKEPAVGFIDCLCFSPFLILLISVCILLFPFFLLDVSLFGASSGFLIWEFSSYICT